MVDLTSIRISQHVWAWALGGVFMCLATIIGSYSIYLHIKWNNSPMFKYEVRVLLMVPIYAIEAWLGLYRYEQAVYWDVARSSYEALVIYSFYQFLLTFLGGEDKLSEILYAKYRLQQKALANPRANKKLKGDSHGGSTDDLSYQNYQNENSETAEELQKQKDAIGLGHHLVPCAWFMRPYSLSNGEFQKKNAFWNFTICPYSDCVCNYYIFNTTSWKMDWNTTICNECGLSICCFCY